LLGENQRKHFIEKKKFAKILGGICPKNYDARRGRVKKKWGGRGKGCDRSKRELADNGRNSRIQEKQKEGLEIVGGKKERKDFFRPVSGSPPIDWSSNRVHKARG